MKQVEIKGKLYTMDELCYLHKRYEVLCTAEYLLDNKGLDEHEAMEKAEEVRRIMDKYDFSEEEAIEKLFKEEVRFGTD